ncbi:hypothetical protein AKH06_18045 [Vibrio parahaemolyticus]|nr:hypothetical protein AKH06_18045 [Vibrio parahaemolyticus]OCP49002.1 hypothetical protein AKH02_04185 [Vibrio parahaemolyticus]
MAFLLCLAILLAQPTAFELVTSPAKSRSLRLMLVPFSTFRFVKKAVVMPLLLNALLALVFLFKIQENG